MSFFIRKKGAKAGGGAVNKRKRPSDLAPSTPGSAKRTTKAKFGSEGPLDDEISSDSDEEDGDVIEPTEVDVAQSSSEEEEETAQEKRLRLAKRYLAQIEQEEASRLEDEDETATSTAVADRLKQDILEQSGRLQKLVAETYEPPNQDDIRICRGHKLPITCVVISSDDKFVFSGSKDCSLIKWSAETGKKVKVIAGGRKGTEDQHVGHTAIVLCLAISTDDKFLASGDKNKLILIWRPDNLDLLHKFTGHRDAVSGLTFRRGSHQLFSASHDRTVKLWNVDEMAYVETLFGHHDGITAIDSLTRERAVTSGGRDGSIRIWKIVEESQLVFNCPGGSIDCVSLINEEHFVSGADNNSLALWSVMKKKPITTRQNAHGSDPDSTPGSDTSTENWISAVASLSHTDLVASGSGDGLVRLWQCADNFRGLQPLFTIPVAGFVNSLRFSSDGRMLVAGVGQEHRLGRWWRNKAARNAVYIIPLRQKPSEPGARPKVVDLKATTNRKPGGRGRRR